jgi:hypothetical protein
MRYSKQDVKSLVKTIKKNNNKLYLCEECGLAYLNEAWALKCEDYCKTHNACSIEITRHAYTDQNQKVRFEP